MKAYEVNPIVGRPFKLECNAGTNISGTVDINHPDGTVIGSCAAASTPFPVTCSDADGYGAILNESAYTIQINTSSMASDVNGTWLCLHDGQTTNFTLDSPLTGNFNLYHYCIFIFAENVHRNDIEVLVCRIGRRR